MKFLEEYGDLFNLDFNKYVFAHCIATDLKWGSGIAPIIIRDKFNVENYLRYKTSDNPNGVDYKIDVGSAILMNVNGVGKFYNLFTKEKSVGKPTYTSFTKSILSLKEDCLKREIKYLAIPKIGCGLDKLDWTVVREIIKGIFSDTEIEIRVRFI